jgi:hypothetical protein
LTLIYRKFDHFLPNIGRIWYIYLGHSAGWTFCLAELCKKLAVAEAKWKPPVPEAGCYAAVVENVKDFNVIGEGQVQYMAVYPQN